MKRASSLVFKGVVAYRDEADPLLGDPGAAALIHRGVMRSIVIACPDGCGENLTINLDPRAGPAWRFYESDAEVSLFPSVWRETGCKSHFIVWRSRIYWCDWYDELEIPAVELVDLVGRCLTRNFVSYVQIADELDVVPWAALSACDVLCRKGIAEAGVEQHRGQFRLKS